MTSAIDSDPDACDVFCQGDVLRTIQLSGLFNVSKDFVDMPLRASPADVLAAFNALPDHTLPTLRRFVDRYFDPPGSDIEPTVPSDFKPEPPLVSEIKDPILREFASAIHGFWKELSFRPCADVDVHPMRHTLLRTRHPIMIVPGGRFRETYYWDTYWIVRGLLACDMVETARHVVENLLDHAEDNHFVPNGGRRYYLSRSQPPLLTLMVADVYDALMSRSQRNDAANLLHYSLGILDGEYSWWMKYSCHAVPVDGQDRRYLLNRYWSGSDKPRPEMYAQDYLAGTIAGNRSAELFSEIAATAESGWDFSNRWLSALGDFATRSTIPVDLNLFLCNVESTLHRMHKLAGSAKQAATYDEARRDRADGMFAVLWSKSDSQWMDYNMDSKTHGQAALASNFLPLWGKCFQGHPRQTQTQAALLKSFANSGLLQVGGVATSSTPPIIVGKYQWDWPNAWAPVQHLLFEGLRQEGRDTNEKQLAREIARRWIQTVFLAYKRTGAIHEKYDATRVGAVGSGGEYVEQVGFGWTNGAVLSMLSDLAREEHQFRVDVDALRKCHDQKYYDCQVIV
ncbi:Trehalase [Plasmodiophora brassicae]|uniref:Trehalase n=1 Tax=Plasmodiophora brassicae TaxID=37360 RepID=A0A0G4IJ46_PLABS|nr:hypothetical protein PBRA_003866 [Plasmodiophora brassicae]